MRKLGRLRSRRITPAVLATLGAIVVLLVLGELAFRSQDETSSTATPPSSKAGFSNPDHPKLIPLPGIRGCQSGIPGTPQKPCAAIVRGQYDIANLTLSPDGHYAYAVSTYSGYRPGPGGQPILLAGGSIATFARDSRTGALRQLPGGDGCIRESHSAMTPTSATCPREARGIQGAKSIIITKNGRFAYVAGLNNDAIAAFSRDTRTGVLKQLSGDAACIQDRSLKRQDCHVKGVGLHGVRWLTLSPDGRNLYAASPASDAIAAFRVDNRTGAITQLPGAAACIADHLARLDTGCTTKALGVNYPRSLTVSPDGRNVYVASDSADASFPGDPADGNAVSAFSRDPQTGALTQLPGDGACVEDETYAPPTTGCPSQGKGLFEPFIVVVSPDGKFAYVGSDESRVGAVAAFARDPQTGALTQLPGDAACIGGRKPCRIAPGLGGSDALTMTPDGRNIYVASFFGLTVAVLGRDADSGRIEALGCVKDPMSKDRCDATARGLNGPRAVVLSPDGRYAYVPSETSGAIAVMAVRSGRGGGGQP